MRIRKSLLLAATASLLTAGTIALAQQPGVNTNFAVVWNMVYEASTIKPTYSSSFLVNLAASPTDVCGLRGSSTKTVRLRRVLLAGAASVVSTEPVAINKLSSANTTGVSVSQTAIPYDSTYAAASALAEHWTTYSTGGTTIGTLAEPFLTYSNYSTGVGAAQTVSFGQFGSAAVLRGTSQQITVNLNGLTIPAGVGTAQLLCTFEWTEDNDN